MPPSGAVFFSAARVRVVTVSNGVFAMSLFTLICAMRSSGLSCLAVPPSLTLVGPWFGCTQ